MPAKKKIGELLIEAGAVSEAAVRAALAMQGSTTPRKRLGELLVDAGAATSQTIAQALATQHELPFIHLPEIPASVTAMVPLDYQVQNRIIPFRLETDGKTERLHLALDEPGRLDEVDELRFQLGKPVRVYLASSDDIQSTIEALRGETEILELLAGDEEEDVNLEEEDGIDVQVEALRPPLIAPIARVVPTLAPTAIPIEWDLPAETVPVAPPPKRVAPPKPPPPPLAPVIVDSPTVVVSPSLWEPQASTSTLAPAPSIGPPSRAPSTAPVLSAAPAGTSAPVVAPARSPVMPPAPPAPAVATFAVAQAPALLAPPIARDASNGAAAAVSFFPPAALIARTVEPAQTSQPPVEEPSLDLSFEDVAAPDAATAETIIPLTDLKPIATNGHVAPSVVIVTAKTRLDFSEEDLRILDNLERLAQGQEPLAPAEQVTPGRMVASLIRLLVQKGLIGETELLEELARK